MGLNLIEAKMILSGLGPENVQIHGLLTPRHRALAGTSFWCPARDRRLSVSGSVVWPWTGHFTFLGSNYVT